MRVKDEKSRVTIRELKFDLDFRSATSFNEVAGPVLQSWEPDRCPWNVVRTRVIICMPAHLQTTRPAQNLKPYLGHATHRAYAL